MQVAAGSKLGPYEVVSRLGAGGMGEVWLARDSRLERNVAIKVLPAELAMNAQFRLRFEREAKTISQLSHPHICTLHDVGDGYLVMELLEGESLADRLVRGPVPLKEVLRYGVEIAQALDRAHRSGIVHRDLKPGNVMITKSGAKLLDFGLAKAAESAPLSGDEPTQHRPLTQEGTIIGTFQYMAPERTRRSCRPRPGSSTSSSTGSTTSRPSAARSSPPKILTRRNDVIALHHRYGPAARRATSLTASP